MADCESCKAARREPENVPYIVHESAMARSDRKEKRLIAVIVLLIVLLVGSNAAWTYYESQFQDVTQTIEAEQDGSGVNIVSGGDLEYGAESKN